MSDVGWVERSETQHRAISFQRSAARWRCYGQSPP